MLAVAVGAVGRLLIPCLERFPVNALLISRDYLGVALATGVGDLELADE